jgi:hypothetical protein
LQEGFASHKTGGEVFTWVYRKAATPFNSNIINVGVERKFYTTEQDTTADDLITTAEGTFATLIRNLRADIPESLHDSQLPHLIAHLEVRTRHLRETFLQTGELLVSKLLDFLSDEEAFAAYMARRIQNDPSILRQSFAEEFAKRGISKDFLDSVMRLSAPLVPTLVHQQRSEFPKLAAMLRAVMPRILKDAAKSGHIKALKGSIAPEVRVQRYVPLTYTIARTAKTPLILGDSVVLFEVDGPRHYKALLDRDDAFNAVFLPLDPERVVIGRREGFNGAPFDLREAIARCSLEYFIAAESSPANELLRDQIGADAYLVEESEMEEILNGITKG